MIASTLARATRVLALLLVLVPSGAGPEPLRRNQVPQPLAPWVDWVLRGHEAETCATLQGTASRACVWPSSLQLSLSERSGSFVQRFSVDVESRVALPGDRRQWPEDVTVNGLQAPVFEAHGAPSLRLPAGRHRVTGRFRWSGLPQQLAIPPATALLRLQLRGEVVSAPSRDARGHLWLGGPRETPAATEDHLEIEVHRRVVDEIPLRLTTLVELEVSGSDREIVLGRLLPAGFVPLSLSGDLPARLEGNDGIGRLRVQLRPGVYRLSLEARHEGPVSQLALPVQPEAPRTAEPAVGDGAFDPVEIWAFDARPRLRLVDVEGVLAVDPSQTELPVEWHALPAYRLGEEDVMRLVARRRGNAGAVRDELQLTRTWHLDFDGRGATVADRLEGELRSGSRLEMGAATRLGRAAVNGVDQPITRRPGRETAGLEVPFGPLVVEAESRVEEAGARLPAVGWSRDVSSLRGTLELPPGFRLFHAAGVDRVARTWIGTWTLLDLFVVMVASMACLRLLGPARGALALIALALTYTEPGAPRLVWLAVLASEALRRVVPAGRLSAAVSVLRAVSLLALVGIALPFAAQQVRTGLYPALERPRAVTVDPAQEPGREPELRKRQDEALLSPAEQMDLDAARSEYAPSSMGLGRTALRQKAHTSYEPDPDASIPTGPGRPAWSWQRVELYWSGPVQADQELRLWLMPPWLNARLALLRTALLAAFVLVALGTGRDLAARLRPGTAGAWIALLALLAPLATLAVAPAARAELPEKPLLDELRARLLAPPDCQPSCASIPLLRLEVTPDRLVATLQIEAAAETAVPLPGVRLADAAGFVPDRVRVGDQPAAALRRSDDGRLWLRLPKGTHSVSVSGPLPALPRVELPLPLRPRRIEARVQGWSLQGLHQDGSSEGALQLSRGTAADGTPNGQTPAEPPTGGRVPPFARVVRELRLGLSWRVETRVDRIAPREGALVLQVPLLPGESVTTDGIEVTDGRALVSLPPGVSGARFASALPVSESLSLTAPEAAPWSETWQVDVSPVWHLEATGIPGITSEAARGRRLFEWRPWPGETVELAIERPAGLGGNTLTIDSSRLVVRPGLRASDASLSLRLRTSQGGRHAITLPKDARLLRFAVDGIDQPLRQEGRQVPVPLRPGPVEVEIDFQETAAPEIVTRLPEIDLGVPSVNASLELVPLRNRWILHLGGPRLGPAVLFWPVLLLLSALAILLGRVQGTPLRGRHWFGLGLGLTQAPLVASLCVGGWLLALGWRRQHGERVQGLRFHGMQLGLVVLTGTALVSLFASIQQGLLGLPEMQIGGNGSSGTTLRWYQDRAAAQLPRPYVLSVSIWFYRAAMLLWSLWIAQALVGWLRWGWAAFNEGDLWRPLRASREASNPE